MKGYKVKAIPFIPALIYGLVWYYGYQSYQGEFGEPEVAYGYIYLFFFLVPVLIAYFVAAVFNLTEIIEHFSFAADRTRLGHLYRLYLLLFSFSLILGLTNFPLLIMPYGSQKDYSIENFNPLMSYLVPLVFLCLGLVANLFFWQLEEGRGKLPNKRL